MTTANRAVPVIDVTNNSDERWMALRGFLEDISQEGAVATFPLDTVVISGQCYTWFTTTSKDIHLLLGKMGESVRQGFAEAIRKEFAIREGVGQVVLTFRNRRNLFVTQMRLTGPEGGPLVHNFALASGN